jgi:hypothetical protein
LKFSRRSLLSGSAATTLSFGIPIGPSKVEASVHGGATGFNGGRSQTNQTQGGGTFLYINTFKLSNNWQYRSAPTNATAPAVPVIELDADGYPTYFPAQKGSVGVSSFFSMPSRADYRGIWYLAWDGTGTLALAGVNYSLAPGFTSASFSGTNGKVGFFHTDGGRVENKFLLITATNAAPNHVRNIRIYQARHEARLNNGEVFNPDAIVRIKAANPGVLRSLGWMGTVSDGGNLDSTATWPQRKRRTYYTATGDTIKSSWWAGITTNNGNDYSLAFPGYTLTDKTTFHYQVNVTQPQASTATVTITNSSVRGQPAVVSHAGHAYANGNSVVFRATPPAPLVAGTVYFIRDVVAGVSYSLSLTDGGAAINTTAASAGVVAVPIPTLNVNGTGKFPLIKWWSPYNASVGGQYYSVQLPTRGILGTATYDATTQFYIRTGGDPEDGNAGMHNGGSPEVFIDLCAAIGAHPHIVCPYLSCEPLQDYITQYVTYTKNNYPWMKPRIEPPNECWNTVRVFRATWYAGWVSHHLWGVSSWDDFNNAYGKWVSVIGQAISAIYHNDRTKYSMLCSFQTVNPSSTRLLSTRYVNVNGGSPAYLWCDRVCGANYMSPDERSTAQELIDAFNYSITHKGNPTQQNTIASRYVVTSGLGLGGAFNKYFQAIIKVAKSMPVGHTIKGLTYYEGGYSPDLQIPTTGPAPWISKLSTPGASQTNPCVLTIAINSRSGEGTTFAGNPAVAGMAVAPSGVNGMTQLNAPGTFAISFTNGSPNITAAANRLQVGQVVLFTNSQSHLNLKPPPELAPGIPYYVVTAGNSFQVSATKGGAPISVTSNTTFVPNGFGQQCTPGWMVLSVSGSTITIDCDATGFSPWTSGGTLSFVYSGFFSNTLRLAGGASTGLGTVNTAMYQGLDALTGANPGYISEFPSNFLYFGGGNVWSVIQPDIYAPDTPQWNSIKAYNGR